MKLFPPHNVEPLMLWESQADRTEIQTHVVLSLLGWIGEQSEEQKC